jgi:isochorismate synthase
MSIRATSEVSSLTIRENHLLNFLFQFSFQNNFSVAVWQLPGKKLKHILLSRKAFFLDRDNYLEDIEAGFVFAPFDRSAPPLFLPAEIQFRIENEMLVPPNSEPELTSHEWLRNHLKDFRLSDNSGFYTREDPKIIVQESDFLTIVKKGVLEIEQGTLEKIVPSRTKSVTLPERFDIASSFIRLCKAYPQAFVSVISSPETGTWMGATPEELVRIEDKTIFRTIALAGTQPYHDGLNLKKVAWTQKEIEEQALVERYIISCFKKIRLREYEEHGPKTVIAGNLMHLRSDFTVNMKETNFPQLGSTMLKLLHPTSAVCGMPLDAAVDFLSKNEAYSREYYSGYLGPVNLDNQIDIFVNLRCMQFLKGKAILYAGAGVTIDSVPEQEWEETEMKMNTLLRVIQ